MATPTNFPTPAVAGEILTAAYVNQLAGAFRVLQVVYGFTTTNTIEDAGVYKDTTLTATITPQSTTNKILVMVCQNGLLKNNGNLNNGLNLRLMRGATNLGIFLTAGGYTATATDNIFGGVAINVLDSPATTSATTYKTQMANQFAAANVQTQFGNDLSTIVLLEISA
jgi:hypothetical protein